MVEFFAPIAKRICEELQTCPFVPTCNGSIVTPQEAVFHPILSNEADSRESEHLLFTSELLESKLGLYMTEPRVNISLSAAKELGIHLPER